MTTKQYEIYHKQKREHINTLVLEYKDIIDREYIEQRNLTEKENKRIEDIIQTLKEISK
tara:strand:- start:6165 stop:6341 length:177 start_codon:yes stop_codon:yes gene_type:complete